MLCVAVVGQAVIDYRTLHKKNKTQDGDKNSGKYNLLEIEDFFLGEWGELIIQDGLKCRQINGADFLRAAAVCDNFYKL